jgi:hypothetical protein
MPNIKQYENPIEGLRPDDRGTQSAVQKGRHIEAAFAQAGNAIGNAVSTTGAIYDRVKTQQDISTGLAQKAQILDNLTTASDVAMNKADPNDHAAAEKWREEQMEPLLQSWVTGFSTQESRMWAEEQAGQIRQHLFEKTAADQARNAGVAVVNNYRDTVTGLSNTALQDPSARDMALRTLDEGTEALIASNPNVTPQMAAQLRSELRDKGREEIAKGAFIGTARANPDAAMADLQAGKYNQILDATTQNQLFGFAESIKREARADQRAQTEMQLKAQKQDFDAKVAAMSSQMFAADGSIQIPPGFHQQLTLLGLHPGAGDGSSIRALGDAAARAVENANNHTFQMTNPSSFRDLAGRIGVPAGSAGELTHAMVDRAYASGQLSNTDYHFLKGAVETAKSDPMTHAAITQINQALERNKGLVTDSNLYAGKLNKAGDQQYDALHFDTFQRFQQLQAGGMSATQAAQVLTDPRDPRGIQANLAPYQLTNKQGLQALHGKISVGGSAGNVHAPTIPLTTPRKQGESAADYLKRTGG